MTNKLEMFRSTFLCLRKHGLEAQRDARLEPVENIAGSFCHAYTNVLETPTCTPISKPLGLVLEEQQ